MAASALWVPSATDLAKLIAERNRASKRAAPLRLSVFVKDGSGKKLARGVAEIQPGGGSRVELDYRDGHREIHERSGDGYRIEGGEGVRGDAAPAASWRGERADYPLLPPFGLLQATSPERVLALLRGLGGDPMRVGLGLDGDRDCWVLGGRDAGSFEPGARPALWIHQESRELIRIDAGDAVSYRLGPVVAFGAIRLPKWIEVRPRDAETLRLEIDAMAKRSGEAP